MTALGQGMAGLALVMAFALLCTRQISAAAILLAIQSAAAAVSAVAMQQPLGAIPPVLLAFAVCYIAKNLAALEPRTAPPGGTKLGVAAAVGLAVLCQSQPGVALPLGVILLSILLAATRRHRLIHIMALVGLQNGIIFTATPSTLLLPLACLALPLPLAAGLLVPHRERRRPAHGSHGIDLALALAILLATLLVPLDPTASMFAPLLGLDGVLRSWARTKRQALSLVQRGLALLTSLFAVLAVCSANPIMAWLALLACIATSLSPTLTRRRDEALLCVLGAGVALFGLTLFDFALIDFAGAGPSLLAVFCVFVGFGAIGAVVPDLAPVLVILILRLANQAPWFLAAQALGISMSVIMLLTCAVLLRGRPIVSLLQQAQASIAALAISLGEPDGRFAGLVLLVLLILSRSAARATGGPASGLAIAGLGGVPPLGVFPGLVLVMLAVTRQSALLLLVVTVASVPIFLASLPRRLPSLSASIGWLPMGLALLTGYLAPDGLVRWWHIMTAGRG
jgi:hypothetical protein